MTNPVAAHYSSGGGLADAIADGLREAGKDPAAITAADLVSIDEFHIRGRKATVELADRMQLSENSMVLDVGSGLGGAARTLAATHGCHVTGVDLTDEFCRTAAILSDWVGLGDKVDFRQGDATQLPFDDNRFDAALTIHAAMNIPEKGRIYTEARRVLKPGGIFAVYDVLQGEGGDVVFPVPWAREPSISFLATPDEMESLLVGAGFALLETLDSTEESLSWFSAMAERMAKSGPPPVTFQLFLGEDFPAMAKNQVRNLAERRIRTVSYICRA